MSTKDVITKLSKDYPGLISSLSELEPIKTFKFGIPSIDEITGGVPVGLISEISGNPSVGKSSLALSVIAQAQKEKVRCAYVDLELALTPELAEQMGVNVEELIIAQPSTGEEAMELIEDMIENGVKLVVIDSVSAMTPDSELEADYMQQTIGLQARLMSKFMRKIIGCARKNDTALLFINQLREKVNTMGYGKKTTTSGGRALPFYAALRLELVRTKWITNSDKEKIGMIVKTTTEKNKLHRPQLSTEVNYYFGQGFDINEDKLNLLIKNKEVEVVGRTYFHGEKKIGDKKTALDWVESYPQSTLDKKSNN